MLFRTHPRCVHTKRSTRRHPELRLDVLEERCVPVTRTWTGNALQGNGQPEPKWDAAANWRDPSFNPGAPVAGDALYFPGTASSFASTNNLAAGIKYERIQIDSNYAIVGNAIELSAATDPLVVKTPSGLATVGLPINFKGVAEIFVQNADATLRLEGAIAGNSGLIKTGPGAATLAANNTYNGATNIQAGTFFKGAAVDAIPNSSNVTVAGGATLNLNGYGESIGALSGTGAVRLGFGPVDLAVGGNGQDASFGGTIVGTAIIGGGYVGMVTKVGNGTWTLDGVISAGSVIIKSGTLKLGTSNRLDDYLALTLQVQGIFDVNVHAEELGSLSGAGEVRLGAGVLVMGGNNSDTTFDGVISGAGGSINKRGTGIMTLTAHNTFTGGASIDAGTLRLGANDVLADDLPVGMNANTVLDMADRTEFLGSLDGSGEVRLGAGSLIVTNNSDMTYAGIISGVGGAVAKRGTGVMTLTGANTFTRGMYIDAGTLKLGADQVLADGVPVGMLANTVLDMQNRTEYIGSLDGLGEVKLGTGSLITGQNNSDTTYAGAISGVGGAVAKRGTGVMTLSGQNTFARGMYIDGGTLRLGANNVLHDSVPLAMLPGATFDVRGFDRIGSLAGAGNVVLAHGIRLWAGGNNSDTEFSGNFTNTGTIGGLSKEGTGVMTLSGGTHNSPDGLGIDNGTLRLAANNIIEDRTPVVVRATGIFDLNDHEELIGSLDGAGQVKLGSGRLDIGGNNSNSTYSGVISGAGRVVKQGTGILTLSGSNTFTRALWVDAGTLRLGADNVLHDSVALDLLMNTTFDLNGHTETVGYFIGRGRIQLGTGTLSVGGNAYLLPTTRFEVNLGGPSTGSFGRLNVVGDVDLGGSTLDLSVGYSPTVGEQFTIIANDGTDPTTGTFNGQPEGAVFTLNGKPYEITYAGGNGNDVVVTRIAAAIVINPLDKLVTTEGGRTATFTVALGSVPTADVTVALSSSDTTEGTISPSTLTFTPANALIPQTVTVTGVGDLEPDDNVSFSIVTAPAVSADPEYSDLNAVDVPVINLGFLPKGTRKFTDLDGDAYTVTLTGPGTVAVRLADPTGNGPGAIDRIVVQDTDPLKSRLSVAVKKGPTGNGRVDVGGIDGSGLRGIAAAYSDVVGAGIQLTGPLGGLAVRDILNGADVMAVGTAAFKTAFRAQVIGDNTLVDLHTPIGCFTAARVGAAQIDAPAIGTLRVTGHKGRNITGDFAADVHLSGAGLVTGQPVLGSATIVGSVTDSIFDVAGKVGSFTAGRFLDSRLFVGFTPNNATDPLAGGSFATGSTLGSFRVTGYNGLTTPAFANSTVAAGTIGSAYMKSVQTTNANRKFGVLADVQIGSVNVAGPTFKYLKGQPSTGLDDFQVKII